MSISAVVVRTRASILRRPRLLRRLRWLAFGVGLVALGFAARTLARDWDAVRAGPVHWAPSWLAASLAAAAASQLLMAAAWAELVIAHAPVVSQMAAIRLWFAGQLGRFMPTGLGSFPARLAVCRAAGIPGTIAAATVASELFVALAVSAAAALLLVPAGELAGLAAGVMTVVLFVTVTRAITPIRRSGAAVEFVLLHVVKMVPRTVGVWALLRMVGTTPPSWQSLAGGIGLAYLAGLVAVFAPGGIGVREAVLAAALTRDGVPASLALGCVFGWRLVETSSEIGLVFLTHSLAWARNLIAASPSIERW